ncbi:formylglycine-generating enzyme family protein [Nannocystis radixulma]|uniref:SUMF1/EgtB/PvdO family nonheme iron enzyme n=1 Tax=Nannocystis radixulma TaxID=2995305 RepID=A0ABT5B100_9BACT|nr:SUMF1/EgtB/PvdO family nonheme iron enzyme [Nannocystis radixulma]MDC0667360.1 SUMF1/EgtB/PvdO family nonheme iron enzyme [Nannocystis radixulma]
MKRHILRTLLFIMPGGCGSAARPVDAAAPAPAASPTAAAVEPSAPAPARDCADEPGMIYIAGGDTVYSEDRKTYHLEAFWLDRTEVTVAAFRKFVEAGYSPPLSATGQRADLACTWNMPQADEMPINCIDWHQAEAYCLWAGKRLPTAQEWGWAARGREAQRKYPWGDAKPSCELAVIDLGQSREEGRTGCGRNRPWPVASKPGDTTPDGVVDMFGNLAERTSTGSTADERSTRIVRGSSFATGNFASSTVDEHGGYSVREAWSDNTGVRCAKDVGPQPPCGATSEH